MTGIPSKHDIQQLANTDPNNYTDLQIHQLAELLPNRPQKPYTHYNMVQIVNALMPPVGSVQARFQSLTEDDNVWKVLVRWEQMGIVQSDRISKYKYYSFNTTGLQSWLTNIFNGEVKVGMFTSGPLHKIPKTRYAQIPRFGLDGFPIDDPTIQQIKRYVTNKEYQRKDLPWPTIHIQREDVITMLKMFCAMGAFDVVDQLLINIPLNEGVK